MSYAKKELARVGAGIDGEDSSLQGLGGQERRNRAKYERGNYLFFLQECQRVRVRVGPLD